MKLNKIQISLLAGVLILTIVLYLLPKKVLTNNKEGANRDKPQQEAMGGNPENPEPLKSLDVILAESITRLTDAEKKDLKFGADADEAAFIKSLQAFKKLNNKLGVAYCMEKLKSKYSETELGLAYYDSYKQSEIDENKKAIAAKVIDYLKSYMNNPKTANSTDPIDIKAKCAYADCYVNTAPAPMNGIMILREVIAVDSTNETALVLLGQFAIKSGQIDKAIGRFESLVRHYPENVKYSLYLAQLFSDQGARDKALETLTSAKKHASRKTAKDSLDNSINQLK